MEEQKKKTGEDYINEIYDAQQTATESQLTQNYQSALSDLDAQKQQNQQNAQESARKTSVQSAQNRQRWNEVQSAQGLSSGANAQGQLSFGNQLQQDLTAINTAQNMADAEIERQRSLLSQQYASAIAEAQANNDFERAQALYQEAQRQEDLLLQKQQNAAGLMGQAGDFSLYGSLYGLTPEQITTLTDNFDRESKKEAAGLMSQAGDYSLYGELFGLTSEQIAALSDRFNRTDLEAAANLMAQAGDFSLYQKLFNLTDEQTAALKAAYDRANASSSGGSSSGGSSSGTGYSSGRASSGSSAQNVILGQSGTYTDDEIAEMASKGLISYYGERNGVPVYRYGQSTPNPNRGKYREDVLN